MIYFNITNKMTHFIALNPPQYISETDTSNLMPEGVFCVCCLSQNVNFVNLNRCKHIEFLNYFFKYKTEFQNTLVCTYCHEILRKIELFKSQVEESMQILNKQYFIQTKIK